MTTTARLAAVFALAAAAACASNPSAPAEPGPVRLTAQINRIQIARGATATAIFRLENTTDRPVTLHFNSACQVRPFIVSRPGDAVVYPAGGSWACAQVVTEVTLAPRSVIDTELTVISGASTPDHVGLAPGDYAFFARLDSREISLESDRVTLQVL